MKYKVKQKVLSLFDGIAGARQALKELNIDCEYYASEIDKYAIQVAKANHPDIMHIGDVKDVDIYNDWGGIRAFKVNGNCPLESYDQDVSEIDLLIGGSPCQDLSIAKKDRKGLQGDRSSLFYEYLRLLNEVKPKYFILENVASMSKASKELITKELFDIEPIMINSALLTAQNRKRLYWVGKLVDGEYKQVKIEQPKDKKIYLKDILQDKIYFGLYSDYNNSTTFDKSRTLGTGCGVTRSATCQQVILEDILIKKVQKGGQKDCVYSINGKKDELKPVHNVLRKLTVTECERLQGFPDNYVSMVSNTQGYKGLGNSFTVPVIKHILESLWKK